MAWDADEILNRMRNDTDSDWPDRLLYDICSYRQNPCSRRELEVLQLISHGHSKQSAANMLGLGEESVKTHAAHALQKLQARNITHAVAIAYRRHLIT